MFSTITAWRALSSSAATAWSCCCTFWRISASGGGLAGADGYGPDGENYADKRMKNHTPRGSEYNAAMAKAIRAQGLAVRFITPAITKKE